MRRRPGAILRSLAVTGALGLLLVGLAPAAGAESIGGDRLSSPRRTVELLAGADPLPEVWAATWIIADAETGDVLAQKGSHIPRPPASTLKMLTALAALPGTSPQDRYVATERAAGIYGARVGLRPGKEYSLDDLWYAVFLPSANDAAIAVAQANGGVRKTVNQMNDVARQLQALDTVARNTSGLDIPGQVSSAYDLALIARAGLSRADFARYAKTVTWKFPDVKGKGKHRIYTTNRLLMHGYKGMIGVKTGFTSQAGRTYVGAARRGGRTLIVALMGISESSESAARKLLDWGFANTGEVVPIGTLVDPLPDVPQQQTAAATAASKTTSAAPAARADATSSLTVPGPGGRTNAILWGAGIVAAAMVAASILAALSRRRRTRRS
ncbi:MAG: D-alanyl-D-alanine carboxypeptidase [Actinomycetota bacterium]|nr:D-alanyl-D-alanine carboxypeptidase [Actinomycetota bacterium]